MKKLISIITLVLGLSVTTVGQNLNTKFFTDLKIPIQEAVMYRTVNTDLSDLKAIKYDIIAFFSALEINSMFEQFPDFKQEDRRICVFGKAAHKAVTDSGMTVNIQAGTPEAPSIAVALENYLKISNAPK